MSDDAPTEKPDDERPKPRPPPTDDEEDRWGPAEDLEHDRERCPCPECFQWRLDRDGEALRKAEGEDLPDTRDGDDKAPGAPDFGPTDGEETDEPGEPERPPADVPDVDVKPNEGDEAPAPDYGPPEGEKADEAEPVPPPFNADDYHVDVVNVEDEAHEPAPLTPEEIEAINAPSPVRIQDGKVVWAPDGTGIGAREYERLVRAGDLHPGDPSDGEEILKLQSLCVRAPYALIRALVATCGGWSYEDTDSTVLPNFVVLGANMVNAHNRTTRKEETDEWVENAIPFTIHAPTGKPYNFGMVAVTIGESGSDKGAIQTVVENIVNGAIPTERAVDFTSAGYFGGYAAVKKDVSELKRGIVDRMRRGIVFLPEGEVVVGAIGQDSKFAALLSEFLSSWRVERKFSSGIVEYEAFPTNILALQLEAWPMFSSSVTRIDRRVLLMATRIRSPAEEGALIRRLEHGLPFDPEALEVVRAVLRNRARSFSPSHVDVSRVVNWIADHVESRQPDGLRFRQRDAQRIVSVAAGMWLLKHVGPVPDRVVLPSPADDPDLLRIIANDARIRGSLAMAEEDSREHDIVARMRQDVDFIGTAAKPAFHTGPQWVAEIVRVSSMAPTTAQFHFYGGRSRRGVQQPSWVDQFIVDEHPYPSMTPEQIADLAQHSGGRPPKVFSWNFLRDPLWEA